MFGHLELGFSCDKRYRLYQCSLCHALGTHYGSFARFLTNYDTVLPLILAEGCSDSQPNLTVKTCPLMSRRPILYPQGPIPKFAAAITILLVREKVRDDGYDGELRYPRFILKWLESKSRKAEDVLEMLGFQHALIRDAFERQRLLESTPGVALRHLAEPTAEVLSQIYAFMAELSTPISCKAEFRKIGYALGQIIYLTDSWVDFRRDLNRGAFNPLFACFPADYRQHQAIIPRAGREECLAILNEARSAVSDSLNGLSRNDYVTEILTERLAKTIDDLLSQEQEIQETAPLTMLEKIQEATPLSLLLSSPRYAFAANGASASGGCCESLFMLIVLLFVLRMLLKNCFGGIGCCHTKPETVTVEHGCGGTKTYRRNPCTGKYRDENQCC